VVPSLARPTLGRYEGQEAPAPSLIRHPVCRADAGRRCRPPPDL